MCWTVFCLETLKEHYVVLEKKLKLYFDFHTYNITEVIIYTWKCSSFPQLNKQAVLRGK